MVQLRKVTGGDYEFLYELLQDRDPSVNISHKDMPTYEQHVRFCDSDPYELWYIIVEGQGCKQYDTGAIYLTRDSEIGVFVKKEFQGCSRGTQAVAVLMAMDTTRTYYANIAPTNGGSQAFFEGLGFELIQHTYRKEGQPVKELE